MARPTAAQTGRSGRWHQTLAASAGARPAAHTECTAETRWCGGTGEKTIRLPGLCDVQNRVN